MSHYTLMSICDIRKMTNLMEIFDEILRKTASVSEAIEKSKNEFFKF